MAIVCCYKNILVGIRFKVCGGHVMVLIIETSNRKRNNVDNKSCNRQAILCTTK